ncbi:MAG: hypothetical protein V4731_05250 [Pseudomonadota bacterium]
MSIQRAVGLLVLLAGLALVAAEVVGGGVTPAAAERVAFPFAPLGPAFDVPNASAVTFPGNVLTHFDIL